MINKKLIHKRKIRKIKCDIAAFIPDKIYIKSIYKNLLKTTPNLSNPQTFNEKLNWMKLYYKKPEFTQMADKYIAKKIVAEKLGKEYVIPLLGVWDKFEDIDFSALPDSFVLKCNNGCGDILICKNKEEKEKLNLKLWKELFDINLKTKYWVLSREFPYKNIKPKIIGEKYMSDNDENTQLTDYKFFCFAGVPKLMYVATERSTNCKFDFYDMNFNHLDIYNVHPNSNKEIKKPTNFEKMKELASQLSENFPFIRIDFYESNGNIYFSEFTFYHIGGLSPFFPETWNYELGTYLELPKKNTVS